MKSIMPVAMVLAAIASTAPDIAGAQETNCGAQCAVGSVLPNAASPAPSTSDDAAQAIGEMLGDKMLSTATTAVATRAPLDDTTRSSFMTGMTIAGGALNSYFKPTVTGIMTTGGSLGSSMGSGAAGGLTSGAPLGGGTMTSGPLGAIGGVIDGIASGH